MYHVCRNPHMTLGLLVLMHELGTESNQDPSHIGMFGWNPVTPCDLVARSEVS